MKLLHKHMLLFVITAGAIYSSCQKNNIPPSRDELSDWGKITIPGEVSPVTSPTARTTEVEYNTFYGPVVQMGEGHARSWANISHDNEALAIGIEMTEGALQQDEVSQVEEAHSSEFVLPLHQKAKALLPIDHIVINWNAGGHPPPGIYTVPHFDFHFYKMSLEERLAIPSYTTDATGFTINPPAGYIPGGYIKAPGGEAKMGAHWMDVTSPEFHGQPFTHTFVYGSYNGKVSFIEPMISLSTLQGGTTIHKVIRQPQYFVPLNKYYPTRYNIWKDPTNNRRYVGLDEMVWR
jgi:hypothetical protein